ncbi:THUMP domain-containing class I SAM-dependent RNA methyltransferase [Evansella cellulosilytica]|uniref:rRNA (Guanine-N(2)-)-methyltransferase n=1 Tax=Evansella cellulosilytica (strain ATCC 21833 / DSM 2522 / FERM P-1141 / JCM 9156 / N-4) TaxID=649639 RepID=E6U291_EVAC2|nr:class I SAM-dependent RNA methyltransferase [Evansella cellulosilytica]ADU30469.1 rRNA (guanine-N(2)-)-methyltransferase [Evansella cellulosilytica DSM 2522]
MDSITLIATAAMGLEAIVADEVRALGYTDVKVENGKVIFEADPSGIARANLWLRTADRVKLLVGEFKATSFEELFEQTKALPWSEYVSKDAEFPVIGKSVKSTLYSVPDCQAIVKKAVVESLKQSHHIEWFEEKGPLQRIEVAILKDIVTLTIDTSGTGLHKRGYRYLHNEAPLKETLAAAMIKLTNWHPDRPFVDPFCGSGTLPIEAAMIGQNIAPGINREFAYEKWAWFKPQWHDLALQEAEDLAKYDQPLTILGTDIDHKMIELASNNATEAGFPDQIKFKQMQAKDFTTKKEYGVIVGNPPYGERMNEKKYVENLYRDLGETYRPLETWSVYMITSYEDFEKAYGKKATKKRKLYNGNIRTDFYQFWGKRPPRK